MERDIILIVDTVKWIQKSYRRSRDILLTKSAFIFARIYEREIIHISSFVVRVALRFQLVKVKVY